MADFVSYATKRDEDRARRRRCAPSTVAAVDSVLAADDFDAGAVASLATRSSFADAGWLLQKAAHAPYRQTENLIETILQTADGRILAYRCAVAFGVLSAATYVVTALDLLRALDSSDAKCALAVAGVIEWSSAARDTRAAFVLRRLVSAFRDGAS